MKKWFIILVLSLCTGFVSFAQDDDTNQEGGGKIQERMREYIQDKLNLTKTEAEKFNPVFFRYFREFLQIRRENKGDLLIIQQRIIELRLRYRTEYRQIFDESRANKVFKFEDQFRREATEIIRENRKQRGGGPLRRTKVLFR